MQNRKKVQSIDAVILDQLERESRPADPSFPTLAPPPYYGLLVVLPEKKLCSDKAGGNDESEE